MRFRKFIPRMLIVLFLILTLAGTYYVRLHILEKNMLAAMESRDYQTVRELAQTFPAPVNARGEDGKTPLHWAVGDEDIMRLLIARGARIDAKDRYGCTPLHWASGLYGVCRHAAELLIANGADVNAKDLENAAPIHHVLFSGLEHMDMVRMLLDKGPQQDIFVAAALGNVGGVEAFLKQDPKLLNAKVLQDWTPLHFAARCAQQEVAALLIARGADVNEKEYVGMTPLHLAASSGDNGVMALLIAKGADVNLKDRRGKTPMHEAAWRGEKQLVDLLLAKGADINAKDNSGRTPLHEAAFFGKKDVADLLIAKGADINAKDRGGKTALRLAIIEHQDDVVEALRKAGAKE